MTEISVIEAEKDVYSMASRRERRDKITVLYSILRACPNIITEILRESRLGTKPCMNFLECLLSSGLLQVRIDTSKQFSCYNHAIVYELTSKGYQALKILTPAIGLLEEIKKVDENA